MLYGLNRYLGTDAQARAANDGRSDVSTSDVVEALPGAATQAAFDTAGNRILANNALLKASPVKVAGWSGFGQTIGNVAKTAAANAATGAASDAAGQLGTTVDTDKGAQLDPQEVANAAGLSAVTAGAAKSLGIVPETANAVRFADGDPEAKARLADLINSDRVAGDPNNPADNARMLAATQTLLKSNLQDATSGLKASIKDAQSQGADTGDLESALKSAQDMKINLGTGYPLDPGQLAMLRSQPSMPVSVANSLADLSEFNRLSQTVSNTQQAQSTPSVLGTVRTLMRAKELAALAGLGAGAELHSVPIGLSVMAIPHAVRAVGGLWNAATTESDPVGEFVSRFSGLQKAATPQQTIGGTPDPTATQAAIPLRPTVQTYPRALLALPPPEAAYGPEGPQSFRMSPVGAYDGLGVAPDTMAQRQPVVNTRPLATPTESLRASSVNEQADMIEAALRHAQGVLDDPSATPEAKVAARAAKMRAVKAGFAMQEAARGGTKRLRVPMALRAHEATLKAKGAHATPEGARGHTETFDVRTPSGTRTQAVAEVRKSRAGLAQGVLMREAARREILEGAKALPLSPHGKAMLPYKLPGIAADLFHNATNQVEAAERLDEALRGFSAGDRAMLKAHFEGARAANGIGLFGTWKHKGTLKRGDIRIPETT